VRHSVAIVWAAGPIEGVGSQMEIGSIITGAALPAAEAAAGVRAAPGQPDAGCPRRESARVSWRLLEARPPARDDGPTLPELPLVGVFPDRYGGRNAAVPPRGASGPRLAARRSASPPAERQ
jgi:hypothetical protein